MKKHINTIRINGFNGDDVCEGQSSDLLSSPLKSQEHFQRFSCFKDENIKNEITQKLTKNEENES